MTQEEAQSLANKLTRIWKPQGEFTVFIQPGNKVPPSGYVPPWHLKAWLDAETFLEITVPDPNDEMLKKQWGNEPFVCLTYVYEHGSHYNLLSIDVGDKGTPYVWSAAPRSVALSWLPLFRRNCWLSGWTIEATAHEKTEWIQGFSHKELESWNLKF